MSDVRKGFGEGLRGPRGERGERGERGHDGSSGSPGATGATGSVTTDNTLTGDGSLGSPLSVALPLIAAARIGSFGAYVSNVGLAGGGAAHPGDGVYVFDLSTPLTLGAFEAICVAMLTGVNAYTISADVAVVGTVGTVTVQIIDDTGTGQNAEFFFIATRSVPVL